MTISNLHIFKSELFFYWSGHIQYISCANTHTLSVEAVSSWNDPATCNQSAGAELFADVQRCHPGVSAGHRSGASKDPSPSDSLRVSLAAVGFANRRWRWGRRWSGSFTGSYSKKENETSWLLLIYKYLHPFWQLCPHRGMFLEPAGDQTVSGVWAAAPWRCQSTMLRTDGTCSYFISVKSTLLSLTLYIEHIQSIQKPLWWCVKLKLTISRKVSAVFCHWWNSGELF